MNNHPDTSFFRSLRFRYGATLLVFFGVAGFLLWEEHQVHILGYLPLVLVLGACAGMHLFMHHGHRAPGPNRDEED